jgi:drug/metabolite transporter (DMT)-like permease
MAAKIHRVLARSGLGRMSSGEYQANLNGMNMFFGAVLGFVLSGTEKLSAWQFGVLLTGLAGVVITVLYISSSKHRLAYSLLALFYAATFPEMMDLMLRSHDLVPDKVRPTLLVWISMTIAVEFWAREKAVVEAS